MLKIWTEEFLSVSIRRLAPLRRLFARALGARGLFLFFYERIPVSDHIEAGSEIYSAALPRSRRKELRAEYETRGGLR